MTPDSIPAVRRLIAYDEWANRRTLGSLSTAATVPARALLWMPHIVGAQFEWLARLSGTRNTIAIWPEWTIEETAVRLDALRKAWHDYLQESPAIDLNAPIEYRNSRGESYSNTPTDIIQHVLMHSHYHRGQIAAEVRAASGTPAISDFIIALRDPEYLKSIENLRKLVGR